jgi:YidC/Oxa1 family membrane protein insertase
MKTILTLIIASFIVFCGVLVVESGLFDLSGSAQTGPAKQGPCILLQQKAAQDVVAGPNEPRPRAQRLEAADFTDFSATGGPAKTVIIGAKDPETEDHQRGFKLQLELSSTGAALRKATFSNGLHNGRPSGFDDRDYENPKPLQVLSPVRLAGGSEILSMANTDLLLVQQNRQFALDELSWESFDVETAEDGSQTAPFAVLISDPAGQPILRLNKTYRLSIGSYLVECNLIVENLSGIEEQVRFNLAGPVGIGREDIRGDMRKVVGGFVTPEGNVVSASQDILSSFFAKFRGQMGLKDATERYQQAMRSGGEEQIRDAKSKLRIGHNLPDRQQTANFLWAAITNKYFAAILRPVPDEGENYCDWVSDRVARFYNPNADAGADRRDETIGVNLEIALATLAPASQPGSEKTYSFQLYLGPKDRTLFQQNQLYRTLGFIHTIDFMPCCCCPTTIIRPLAFAILILMKWMYGFIGNYGVVIIILVLLVRFALYPLSKKSQVSMSKMSKLAPKTEEIKKKYANNKAEMNKQLMALYKEQGATPIMGMLPMMAQMPIWIALYSAIYASIELRGAPFLPFWITDLSAPDALIRFRAVTLPLFGTLDSVNLLPILMGVAFYLQQKLMPSQSAASTNPQVAQQQKMMMVMLPILFPLMLYKGPSGLNLYIMSSVFAGVVEQYVIRKHIQKREQQEAQGLVSATSKTGGKVKKKKPKPFFRF